MATTSRPSGRSSWSRWSAPSITLGRLFTRWQHPPLFPDAVRFLAAVDAPVIVVSNVDRRDITAAIAAHELDLPFVVTSEDVRSYKPRPELFTAGLDLAGVEAHRALHVGDSLTSDVAGARALGIPVAWVNRRGRSPRDGIRPDYEVPDLDHLIPMVAMHRSSGWGQDRDSY